ncbi:MAG: hypothetical protein KDC27_18320 [Acidobacteria bacterium]|nr:hypothetical protein [Acidobacteriota bacterium]
MELDADGLMSYCGKCAGLLRGTKKHCIYCGEPSPHSPKYKKRKEASWIEEVLLDPRVQMAIVGLLLVVAALPAVTPVRYRMTSTAPFVDVVWEVAPPEQPARVELRRRDAYTAEPLFGDEDRPDGMSIAQAAGVARDSQGNLYVSDAAGHRVIKIMPSGARSVLAGVGAPGFSGDGRAADQAALNSPRGLAVDEDDNVYIADSGNNRIRRVNAKGIIKTIAGSDSDGGASSDALARFAEAEKAGLLAPSSVFPDKDGDLYITESACAIGERKPTVWVLKQRL